MLEKTVFFFVEGLGEIEALAEFDTEVGMAGTCGERDLDRLTAEAKFVSIQAGKLKITRPMLVLMTSEETVRELEDRAAVEVLEEDDA